MRGRGTKKAAEDRRNIGFAEKRKAVAYRAVITWVSLIGGAGDWGETISAVYKCALKRDEKAG